MREHGERIPVGALLSCRNAASLASAHSHVTLLWPFPAWPQLPCAACQCRQRKVTSAAKYVASNYADWCSLTGSQQPSRLEQSRQHAYSAANASDLMLARLCTDVILSGKRVHVRVTAT